MVVVDCLEETTNTLRSSVTILQPIYTIVQHLITRQHHKEALGPEGILENLHGGIMIKIFCFGK